MYIIMVYDINVKRVNKILKIGRRYLTWVQNSVLEGELTLSQFRRLKMEVASTMDADEDSVRFYTLRREEDLRTETLGVEKNEPVWML